MNLFNIALDHVLKWEGGYVKDPRDPGGATKFGIALHGIGRFLGFTEADIESLTKTQAKKIYRDYYYEYPGIAKVAKENPGLAFSAFDAAVNQGQRQAAIFIQKAVGSYPDGVIGPNTLHKVKYIDNEIAIDHFTRHRLLHYSSLLNLKHYFSGWFRRALDTYKKSLKIYWNDIQDKS